MTPEEELNNAKKRIEELSKEYKNLSGMKSPFQDFKGDLEDAKIAIQQMNELIDITSTKSSDIAVSFTRIVEEVRKSNEGLKMAGGAFARLSKHASKLQDHQSELSELNSSDLIKLQTKVQLEEQTLKNSFDLLDSKVTELEAKKTSVGLSKSENTELEKSLSAYFEINAILEDKDGLYEGLIQKIKEETAETKKLEKNMGTVSTLVDGIDGGLKKAGFSKFADRLNLKGALEDGKNLAKQLQIKAGPGKDIGGMGRFKVGAKVAGGAIGNIAKSFAKGGAIAVGIAALAKVIKFFIDAMTGASKQIAEFQRGFAISREEASSLRDRTKEISGAAGTLLLTQKQITQSLQEMNKAFGIAFDFTSKMGAAGVSMLKDFTKLRDNFGLSAEALKGLTGESIRTGESIESISEEVLGQTALLGMEKGVMLDMNEILEEVGKTSGNIRASFAGGTKELTNAVLQARYLGLTLQQSDKIAGSLLNFESSIEAEMQAELLLGKQLNFEKARSLALDNDLVGATQEIIKQVGSYNDFLNLNRIEREAIAKAAGLTTDELADSLRKQEELNKLGGVALLLGKKASDLQNMSMANILKEANAIEGGRQKIIDLLGEEAYQRKLSEDATVRFAKVMDRVQEIFANLVDGEILDKFAKALTKFVIIADEEGLAAAIGIPGLGPSAALEKKAEEAAANIVVLKEIKEELVSIRSQPSNINIDSNKMEEFQNMTRRKIGYKS